MTLTLQVLDLAQLVSGGPSLTLGCSIQTSATRLMYLYIYIHVMYLYIYIHVMYLYIYIHVMSVE